MRIPEAITVMRSALIRKRPIVLTSGPGIGKTSIVEQVCEDMGYQLKTTYSVYWDITDPKGLPMPSKSKTFAEFLPFGEVKEILDATEPTVWFFDDFMQTSEEVQAALMPLFLKRTIGGRKIPDCVHLALAGNRVDDGSAVNPMLEALKNRMAAFVRVDANIHDWTAWAMTIGKVSPILISFLRMKPNYLYDLVVTSDMVGSATPRSWKDVDEWFQAQSDKKLQLKPEIFEETIGSIVGEDKASEFVAFMQMYKTLNILDQCLMNPETVNLPKKADELYALSSGISSHVTAVTFPNVIKLATRLFAEDQGDAGVLLVQMCVKENPALAESTDYIAYSTSSAGQLQLV